MKTQIENLINGSKQVRRDLSNSKYINCARATSHIGYAGTNRKDRKEIADKVIFENPNGLEIEMFGKVFHLEPETSLSGKTIWFSTSINFEDFMLLSGYNEKPFKNEASFTLSFNQDMTVCIHMFSRKNERGQWRYRSSFNIGEEFVTIL